MAKIGKKAIVQDLNDQLARNGTFGKHYEDLVQDYAKLWDVKDKLQKDIDERGVVVIRLLSSGVESPVKNDSVSELIKVNAQMLKILDALGIEPSQGGETDDEL